MNKGIRCINRETNKVRFFAAHMVNNPMWRKHTGFEPQAEPREILTPIPAAFKEPQAETEKPKRKGGRPRKQQLTTI